MWPSLPASGRASFSEVSCPQGPSCTFPNCFFRHEVPDRPPPRPPTTMASQVPPAPSLPGPNTESAQTPESRLSAAPRASTTPSASTAPSTSTAARTSTTSSTSTAPSTSTAARTSAVPNASTSSRTSIAPSASTATRASTALPSSSSSAATAKPTANSDAPVNLRPLQLAKAPAVYTRRAALLQALHEALKKHNDKMTKARDPDTRALHLNENQLKQLAIDEEAEIAISHRSVYENILKQRIVKLKTMPPEAWAKERRAAIAGDTPEDNRVETGLSPEDEITFVRTMICNQEDLRLCNYVTRSPSEAEVKETRLALDAAAGWEMCDRCKTRFQVFPDRNEQGKLTTGGECTFHWGKYDRFKEQHTCCGREMGSQGCTTHDTHVFSFKDPKRLAVVMPFIHTPENDQIPKSSAVSCDCEMGYTTSGFELLRLTVLSWPQHELLVDVLVRPFGKILDFNTRFSGVTKDQFVSAKAYDPANPRPVGKELRIVESPRVARELFLSHVSPETPIIGHGLENDLNVIRLIHPLILDTGILYQTKKPLPIRLPLRVLAKDHLHEDIQQAGEAGHDSYEDSRAAGELVRLKVKKLWARDKADGWKFRDGGVHPPTPPRSLRQPPPSADTRSMAPTANMTGSMATRPATKRKLEDEEEEGDSTVPPAKKLLMQMLGTKKCDL